MFALHSFLPLSKFHWLELTGSEKILLSCQATVSLHQLHLTSEVGDVTLQFANKTIDGFLQTASGAHTLSYALCYFPRAYLHAYLKRQMDAY